METDKFTSKTDALIERLRNILHPSQGGSGSTDRGLFNFVSPFEQMRQYNEEHKGDALAWTLNQLHSKLPTETQAETQDTDTQESTQSRVDTLTLVFAALVVGVVVLLLVKR